MQNRFYRHSQQILPPMRVFRRQSVWNGVAELSFSLDCGVLFCMKTCRKADLVGVFRPKVP
ncbi:MAG: hypothetical protein ACKPJD_18990, partial [Planctomycetaceae bacterium]